MTDEPEKKSVPRYLPEISSNEMNCQFRGMREHETGDWVKFVDVQQRISELEGALRVSPCSCQSYGSMSLPSQPTDHSSKHWCARCLALKYDKNPEPKPNVIFPLIGQFV